MNEPSGHIKDARMRAGVTSSDYSEDVADRIEDGRAVAKGESAKQASIESELRRKVAQ